MASTAKLSGEERRASIIRAVRHLFANKGFEGTTTRELAEAAGVSEALLYRHFPTKEDLFRAIQESFCNDQVRSRFERLSALEPSSQTLVLLVHFIALQVIGSEDQLEDAAVRRRMLLRSLAEDGEFARLILQPVERVLLPKIAECLRSAVMAGDAVETQTPPEIGGWFIYNLASMVAFQLIQGPPVVDFGTSNAGLVGHVVRFALRGIGVQENAIRQYYRPEVLLIFGT